jgi:hypothetical protein
MDKKIERFLGSMIGILVITLLFLVGCTSFHSSTPAPSAPIQVATLTQTSTPLIKTVVHFPTQKLWTDTLGITLTATIKPYTQTSEPTSTATVTVSPTREMSSPSPTPVPTLSSDGAHSLVIDLLHNNGGCQFPCIWNLTPGKTSTLEAGAFISEFGSITKPHFYDTSGGTGFELNQNNLKITFDISFYHQGSIVEMLEAHAMGLRQVGNDTKGVNLFSDSPTSPLLEYYTPSQIFTNYGKPTMVLVGGFYNDRGTLSESEWKFSIVLDYARSGFFVEFLNFGKGIKETIFGCPSQAWELTVWSWSVDRNLTLETSLSTGAGGGGGITAVNIGWFKSIELVTPLTLDEFYQEFKDPNNTSCLETPISLWKP